MQQETGENVSFELPEIPTDAEGAAKWFSDPNNQATIESVRSRKSRLRLKNYYINIMLRRKQIY